MFKTKVIQELLNDVRDEFFGEPTEPYVAAIYLYNNPQDVPKWRALRRKLLDQEIFKAKLLGMDEELVDLEKYQSQLTEYGHESFKDNVRSQGT